MSLYWVAAQTIPTAAAVDILTKLSELIAAHGVYALLVIFLFYQQSKTLKAYLAAKTEYRDYLRRNHQIAVRTTSVLLSIAIPVWLYATFIYAPKTVIWGDVANLTQMAGDPRDPGQIIVDQQVLPEQSDVKFYVDSEPKKGDPSKITLYWALVEDGQYNQIPMVLHHRVKEWVTGSVALDPTGPPKPFLSDVTRKVRFVVRLGGWSPGQRNSFDYQYDADATDRGRKIGTMRLLRNGKDEKVTFDDLGSLGTPAIRPRTWPRLFPKLGIVFAQDVKPPADAVKFNRALPLLGSRDLKQQQAAQETLKSVDTISWDDVRKVITNPQATADHTLFVRGLSEVVHTFPAKGVAVPSDIRLRLAKDSYQVGDFKTATELFNGLTDVELGGDVTNYYYRGVANLQTGDFDNAAKYVAKYMDKAPTPGAKAAAESTLRVANQQAQGKK